MTEIEKTLIDRDEYTAQEANEIFHQMCDRVLDGEDPEEVLEEFELETEYLLEIL